MAAPEGADHESLDPLAGLPDEDARALRPFFRGGRLVRVPARRSRKLLLLDRLAQEFDVGTHYPEVEVNERLRRFHDDVAALRRYLVDEGFLDRDGGEYWRAGGTVR